jgi:hypothetical protein
MSMNHSRPPNPDLSPVLTALGLFAIAGAVLGLIWWLL